MNKLNNTKKKCKYNPHIVSNNPNIASICAQNLLETIDTFVAAVPWDKWRTVLVHHRRHGGRAYIRFRTWNKHREKLVMYPTKRGFVIPVDNAEALASALLAGVTGEFQDKPEWLVEHEKIECEKAVAQG